jgi:hypothetical protein
LQPGVLGRRRDASATGGIKGRPGFLSEENLVHHTSSPTFHEHYGRENILRNNSFAFGAEGGLARSRDEAHVSLLFEQVRGKVIPVRRKFAYGATISPMD